MFTEKVKKICDEINNRLEQQHIKNICGKELLLISNAYPGLWLEHVYDAVFYAKTDPSKLYLAKNTIEVFIENQKEDGQYPFRVFEQGGSSLVEYTQIQECVSFLSLAFEVAEMLQDSDFDRQVYRSGQKWVHWLETNRMTLNRGLVEMFVGYDTGHDNSGRLEGLSCKGNYILPGGEIANAAVLPAGEQVAPIIAVDMNCNFFGNLNALARFAEKLGYLEEAVSWRRKAQEVKKKLFAVCFSEEDTFFYDVDCTGKQRKYLSSTVFHLFLENVLDLKDDRELIAEIYKKHLKNPNEFWTPYPFPSMAVCDKSCENHAKVNCWGYYTQGLIVLRCTRWMEAYGWHSDFKYICEKWLQAWTDCFDRVQLGQELDPFTGEPTKCSAWYSSCMLMYRYIAENLYGIK